MAKKNKFVALLAMWASLLATLAIGFAMTSGVLFVPWIGNTINQIAGWVIVVGGVMSLAKALGIVK